jgi:hypothetical protein
MTSDTRHCYLTADDCRLADLIDLVNQKTDLADYPYASTVEQNVPSYDGARLRAELSRPAGRAAVEAELAGALLDGPGIVVLAGAFDDLWVVDQATRQFEAIITAERAAGGPVLILQGAVAHTDMPAETGPTMYLPHSQKYLPGYLAYRRPEFRQYFEAHRVQLPLRKGDAVFFNPALFHAAGANRTAGVRRMANLLQVSSAFGRAMEAIDRSAMSLALSPAPQAMADDGASPSAVANVIAACAEGYPFPANLDLDQPVDGLAPPTQAEILARAVAERWSRQQLETELSAWNTRRTA